MREDVILWLAKVQVGIQLVCRSSRFVDHTIELACKSDSYIKSVRGSAGMLHNFIVSSMSTVGKRLTEVEFAVACSLANAARSTAESQTVTWTGQGCEAEKFVDAARRLHDVFSIEMPVAIERLKSGEIAFPADPSSGAKPVDESHGEESKPPAGPKGKGTPVDDNAGRTSLVPSPAEFQRFREFAHGLSQDDGEGKVFTLLLARLDDAAKSDGLPLRASEADIAPLIDKRGTWKFNTSGEWKGLQTRLTKKLKSASIPWRVSSDDGAHLCRATLSPKRGAQPLRKAHTKRARTPR